MSFPKILRTGVSWMTTWHMKKVAKKSNLSAYKLDFYFKFYEKLMVILRATLYTFEQTANVDQWEGSSEQGEKEQEKETEREVKIQ